MKHIPSMDYVFQKLQWEGFNLIHMKFPIFSKLFLPIAIFYNMFQYVAKLVRMLRF